MLTANGAGKTTLLRLLSGKRLAPGKTITISGVDPFTQTVEGITYLGLEWVLNPVVRTDMGVPALLASVGGDAYPERRDRLVELLDIDPAWRMHTVSDGERRRVQLAMGLVRPWKVLLLDEITVDLDLLTRANLLGWLKRESETGCGGAEGEGGKATVVYATHVFGAGQGGWATHLVRMHLGTVKGWGPVEEFLPNNAPRYQSSRKSRDSTEGVAVDGEKKKEEDGDGGLGRLVLKWLREALAERGPRAEATGTRRGGEGKTYQSLEGKGGYGLEKRVVD